MRRIGKLYSKTERNGEDPIWYQWFKIYEIYNLNYLNMLSCTTFAWNDLYVDELNQIMILGGTPVPGVARVITTLSRIMV